MSLRNEDFKNILTRLSPVLMGIKPAELLTIKYGCVLEKCYRFFEDCEVKYIEIKDFSHPYRKQLFFYHRESLTKALEEKTNKRFLEEIGYPVEFEFNQYLDLLVLKLQSDVFPHEIGVFLGYPLKDVLGYMGLLPLKLIKVEGWKYYGSEKLSAIQYKNFVRARDIFKVFLSNIDNSISRDSS